MAIQQFFANLQTQSVLSAHNPMQLEITHAFLIAAQLVLHVATLLSNVQCVMPPTKLQILTVQAESKHLRNSAST